MQSSGNKEGIGLRFSSDNVKTVITLADISPGMQVIDLGSGDGRVAIEFAKHEAIVTGYEIKPALVERSKKRVIDANVESRVKIFNQSFWEVDLSPFELIYIYGMHSIMGKLEKKLDKEARSGTKIILNIFKLPRWKIKKSKDGVHVYIKG
jgi:cyclopropane fatty-acyl-phospholipid synthase-like methyltransferase